MNVSITLPELYELQREIADDPARFKTIVCGRRWGKTLMCVEICFKTAFTGGRVWWVAHTYSVAGIAWRMTLSLIRQIPKEFGIKVNIATRTITFTLTGGEFVFKSSDRPDTLRGEALNLLVMDEADFHKKDVWLEILRPALADRKGKGIFISTPKFENGWFHQMYKQGMDPRIKSIKSWRCSSYTNPYLDPEELDELRATMPDILFRQEILAEFVSGAGARVQRENIQYFGLDELKGNKNLVISLGVDLAISEKTTADYTAIVVMARDKKTGYVYILDVIRDQISFKKQKALIKKYADKWNRPDLGWPEPLIGIEDVGYQKALVQEVSSEVGYAVYGIPSVKDKIAKFAPVESRYELRQVFHAEQLPLYFENELLSFPDGENDDMEDAEGFALKTINIVDGFMPNGDADIFVFEKDNVFNFEP